MGRVPAGVRQSVLVLVLLIVAVSRVHASLDEVLLSPANIDQCAACVAAAEYVFEAIDSKVSNHVILDVLVGMCDGMHAQDHTVCHGIIVDEYGPVFIKNLKKVPHDVRKARDLCDWFRFCDSAPDPPAIDAYLRPAAVLPDLLTEDERLQVLQQHKQRRADGKVLRILHLTDIHPQPDYKVGTATDCGEPVCCREENGPGDAGQFGDYNCDLPLPTLKASLDWATANLDYDVVVWSDDKCRHKLYCELTVNDYGSFPACMKS